MNYFYYSFVNMINKRHLDQVKLYNVQFVLPVHHLQSPTEQLSIASYRKLRFHTFHRALQLFFDKKKKEI